MNTLIKKYKNYINQPSYTTRFMDIADVYIRDGKILKQRYKDLKESLELSKITVYEIDKMIVIYCSEDRKCLVDDTIEYLKLYLDNISEKIIVKSI